MQSHPKKRFIRSFRGQLIVALLLVSVLPLIIIQAVSYYRIENIMKDNTNALIEANASAMLRGVKLTLDGYESVLNQLYADDDLVAIAGRLNENKDVALNTNQLIRALRGACYAKEHIQGITVILKDGRMVFYDKLTGSTIRNAWMEQGGIDPKALYNEISVDNKLHLLPTQYAAQVVSEKVYVFHMAKRLLDYKNIEKQLGVIVLTVDETLLRDTLSVEGATIGVNVLLDGEGRVISAPISKYLGTRMQDPFTESVALAAENGMGDTKGLRAYAQKDKSLNWQLVSVLDQGVMLSRIVQQQQVQLLLLLLVLLLLALVIGLVTGRMSASVKKVAGAMRGAGAGDMGVRVEKDKSMPAEMAAIAEQFNLMMDDISHLIGKVREASKKQRDAEITMLEAQINPHFLYNTLDTINWMAIDENQMEISRAITALARIFRYSIDRSNRRVAVSDEVEWLKQYLSLQQMRLKNAFTYDLSVSQDALLKRIHKLMFQPFVENAIRHGFMGLKRQPALFITIGCENDSLAIKIEDNGRGMEAEKLAALREAIANREEQPGHIGIVNAVSRLRMYYGDEIEVAIDSGPDMGTRIQIRIPLEKEGESA